MFDPDDIEAMIEEIEYGGSFEQTVSEKIAHPLYAKLLAEKELILPYLFKRLQEVKPCEYTTVLLTKDILGTLCPSVPQELEGHLFIARDHLLACGKTLGYIEEYR